MSRMNQRLWSNRSTEVVLVDADWRTGRTAQLWGGPLFEACFYYVKHYLGLRGIRVGDTPPKTILALANVDKAHSRLLQKCQYDWSEDNGLDVADVVDAAHACAMDSADSDSTASDGESDSDADVPPPSPILALLSTGVDVFTGAAAWLVTQQYTNQNFSETVLGLALPNAAGSAAEQIAQILLAKAAWRSGDTFPDKCTAVDTLVAYPLSSDQAAGCLALYERRKGHVNTDVASFITEQHISPLHMWVSDDDRWSCFQCDCDAPWMGEDDDEFKDKYGPKELEFWRKERAEYPLDETDRAFLRACVEHGDRAFQL